MKRILSLKLAGTYEENDITFAITQEGMKLTSKAINKPPEPYYDPENSQEILKLIVEFSKKMNMIWPFNPNTVLVNKVNIGKTPFGVFTTLNPRKAVVFCSPDEIDQQGQIIVPDGQNQRKFPK